MFSPSLTWSTLAHWFILKSSIHRQAMIHHQEVYFTRCLTDTIIFLYNLLKIGLLCAVHSEPCLYQPNDILHIQVDTMNTHQDVNRKNDFSPQKQNGMCSPFLTWLYQPNDLYSRAPQTGRHIKGHLEVYLQR